MSTHNRSRLESAALSQVGRMLLCTWEGHQAGRLLMAAALRLQTSQKIMQPISACTTICTPAMQLLAVQLMLNQ